MPGKKSRPNTPVKPDSIPYEIDTPKNGLRGGLQGRQEKTSGSSEGATKAATGLLGRPGAVSKLSIEDRLDEATEKHLLDVLEGRDIAQTGPTGKRFKGPANLQLKTKAAELWLARRRPTLTATAVKAVDKEDNRPPVSDRELAQTLMGVLRKAEVETQVQEKAALTGAAAGEEASTNSTPPALPPSKLQYPEEPLDPKHGHKVEALNGTGAYLRYFGPEHGFGGRWGVFNGANQCLGRTPRWANAVKALMNTAPAMGPKHPDPFEMDTKGFEYAEARMERKAREQPRPTKRRRG